MPDYSAMRQLGLSKAAVACYQSLRDDGATFATDLAERLGTPRTSLYRVLDKLEEQGFVNTVKTTGQPTYFYAARLDEALNKLASYQRHTVAELVNLQREQRQR